MESTQEEAMGSNSSDSGEYVSNVVHAGAVAVVKGKRTKRQRTASQLQLFPASVSPADFPDSSSASSAEEVSGSVTEEEEDMANCLILLAQGRAFEDAGTKLETAAEEAPAAGGGGSERVTSRRFAETATTTDGKVGYYVYECKTCSKCFPSFQALGGHRASHKKPKLTAGATLPSTAGSAGDKKDAADEYMLQISMNSFTKQMATVGSQLTAGALKPRVHECAICGAEFNSGQALGGHMRRHRPLVVQDHSSNVQEAVKKDKNLLTLDLNLPAPSDDDRRPPSPGFSLNSKRPLFLSPSASALVVDCHY